MDTAIKKIKKPSYMNVVYGVSKLLFAMMTCIELYYFSAFLTDAAMIATAIAAMVLSVTGIIDFIISLFLGVIIETVKLPWGKYRSWLLIAPPIVTVTLLLMFSKVSSNDMVSAVVIIIGFVVSHIFWSLGEAAWNAMPLAMTDDLDQRASLSLWGGRGSMGNTLLFGLIAVPIMTVFKNLTGSAIWGYALLGVVLGILYWIGFWWLFFTTKGCEETAADNPKGERPKSNLGTAFKGSFTNCHLLVTMLGVACTYCYMIMVSSTMYYFFTYSLGGGGIMAFMGTFVTMISLMRLVGSILVPLYLKWFKGKKRSVYVMSFICYALFSVLAYILNLAPIPTLVLVLIGTFFGCGNLAMQLGLFMDCAVYSEYTSGKEFKGFVMALMPFCVKLGITVKNFIVSGILVNINYSATATDTSAYGPAFRFAFLIVPSIICVVYVVVNLLVYRLDEKKVAEMQIEIDARKATAQ